MERSKYSTIIALDFGTTYSGYAYLSKSKFTRNPLKIRVNQAWKSGYRQFLTLKTPTCVLLDIKKEFKCFGYDAENEYGDKCMDDIHNDYYFFRGFNIKKVSYLYSLVHYKIQHIFFLLLAKFIDLLHFL